MKPKVSRRKKIIKIRAEINEIEKRQKKLNEMKSLYFEKIKKMNEPLLGLTQEKRRLKYIK